MVLRVGTSGWHYPTGRGTWNGIFYPLSQDRERGFDELRFYAERFNTVEVNSTFYGQPRASVSLDWVRRTPPEFEFSIKLHQTFTHPAMSGAAAMVGQSDVDQFKGGLDPLVAAGRLGPILAQFPSRFHRTPEAETYLDWLLRTFGDYAMAVEFRHDTWSRAPEETRALLDAHGAAWVQIDEPKFGSSIRQDFRPNGHEAMYLRLHGRNAAQWWDHEAAEDRYNYRYSTAELEPIAQKVREARMLVKKVYLYLNNHFSAQSVANAATLRKMLAEPVTARLPAELVERFPELDGVPILPRARLL